MPPRAAAPVSVARPGAAAPPARADADAGRTPRVEWYCAGLADAPRLAPTPPSARLALAERVLPPAPPPRGAPPPAPPPRGAGSLERRREGAALELRELAPLAPPPRLRPNVCVCVCVRACECARQCARARAGALSRARGPALVHALARALAHLVRASTEGLRLRWREAAMRALRSAMYAVGSKRLPTELADAGERE